MKKPNQLLSHEVAIIAAMYYLLVQHKEKKTDRINKNKKKRKTKIKIWKKREAKGTKLLFTYKIKWILWNFAVIGFQVVFVRCGLIWCVKIVNRQLKAKIPLITLCVCNVQSHIFNPKNIVKTALLWYSNRWCLVMLHCIVSHFKVVQRHKK